MEFSSGQGATASVDSFRDQMIADGVDPGAEPIVPNGKLTRFHVVGDRRGTKNGWYVLFLGGGAYGCWKRQINERWHNADIKLTKAKRAEFEKQIRAARAEAEAEQKRRYAAAAIRAQQTLSSAKPLSDSQDNPYLRAKHITVHIGGLRVGPFDTLLVPIVDVKTEEVISLQYIFANGQKRFSKDARKQGGAFVLGRITADTASVGLCEGLATAATIFHLTECEVPIVVTFDCANLVADARAIREKYPNIKIFIFGDDDRLTPNNPGLRAAEAAALAAGGTLAMPKFRAEVPGSDWNDLHVNGEPGEARKQLLAILRAGLPADFVLEEDALYLLTESGRVEVCSHLEVAAMTRDSAGNEWGRLLTFRDADGREHRWLMDMAMLADDGIACRRGLLSLGLAIRPSETARSALNQYLQLCQPDARIRFVSRLGWDGGNFVFPNEVLGGTQDEPVLYRNTFDVPHSFNVRGSLPDWQREIAERCIGNSRLIFVVSAAFAPVLLFDTNSESGGIHFVGPSSEGKTTLLHVGGSVWGGVATTALYNRGGLLRTPWRVWRKDIATAFWCSTK
jgi:putative DNA primase/helicase